PSAQPQTPSAVSEPQSEPADADQTALAGETLTQQREIFLFGYRYYHENNRDNARKFLQRALEVYPQLADYSLYYLALLNRDEGQSAEAQTVFQRLLTEHADSVWVGRAALELAKLALAENNWTEAARYAEQARNSRMSLSPVRQEAVLVLAQAQEGQGELADAYNLYQELRHTAPRTTVGKTAKEHVQQLRLSDPTRFGLDNDHEYVAEVRLLNQEGDNAEVEELARQFNEKFPTSPLRAEILALLANAY